MKDLLNYIKKHRTVQKYTDLNSYDVALFNIVYVQDENRIFIADNGSWVDLGEVK